MRDFLYVFSGVLVHGRQKITSGVTSCEIAGAEDAIAQDVTVQMARHHTDTFPWMDTPPRKRRYSVAWPLRYRRLDDSQWRPGRTINMSVSGVLFEAEVPLNPDEAVELSIMFQAGGRHIPSSLVTASGHVVRTEPKIPAVIAVKFAS